MKGRTPLFLIALCLTLNQILFAQSVETRPRRAEQSSSNSAQASAPEAIAAVSMPAEKMAQSEQASLLESMVPRAGLQFYLEVRSSGLAQISQSPDAMAALSKAFGQGSKIKTSEMAGFVVRNLSVLSNARLAVAGYGASNAAAIIEVASPADTERLKADLSRVLKSDSVSQTEQASETAVAARGRVVIAGARSVVESLMQSDAALTLNEDREYLKARAHFAGDPFFAYLDTGSMPLPLPAASQQKESQAYMAGMLAGLNQMPYAIAMGGSMQSEEASLRALIISNQKVKGGFLSSIFSAVHEGQPTAASLAASDTDLFVNVMIDWDKLYEGLQSLFDLFASAIANVGSENQSAAQVQQNVSGLEIMAGLDAKLGFSIRNDLLPTLGNEIAIAISGFDGFAKPPVRQASSSRKQTSRSRLLLMIAVRNPVKFESYLAKLLNLPNKTPVSFAQTPYRGAMIKYRGNFAYAMAGGFFIAGGNVAEVRRALDARSSGLSLAASTDFRSAVGPDRPVMLQAYLSSKVSGGLGNALSSGAEAKPLAMGLRAPVGLVMTTNPDGTMMQIRMPSRMVLAALTSIMTPKSDVPGISYSPGAAPSSGQRRRSPMLTTEDLRYRRP